MQADVGDRVLIRLLNAAYGPVVLSLPFDAECVGMDGHALGGAEGRPVLAAVPDAGRIGRSS